jgi:hypothetical protein
MTPATSSSPEACAVHADRSGHARCMTCRIVLCDECATTWDGIHYCTRCLIERRGMAPSAVPWASWILLLLVVTAALYLHGPLLVGMGAFLAKLL